MIDYIAGAILWACWIWQLLAGLALWIVFTIWCYKNVKGGIL